MFVICDLQKWKAKSGKNASAATIHQGFPSISS